MNEDKKRKTLAESEAEMIKVTDEYLIDIDPYNYIAKRKGVVKPMGYFGNIQNALGCIYDDMCKRRLQTDARTLSDAMSVITSCKEEFSAIIKGAFPEYEVVKK